MKYLEIEQSLSSRGVYFDINEYYFVLSIVLGESEAIAYATTIDLANYLRAKETDNEREYLPQAAKEAKRLLQKQHIIKLKEELDVEHKRMVQDIALHLEDIELTASDIKKVLATFLRDRIDDPSSAPVKEIVDLLKMYQPYMPDDTGQSNFQRHFIQVHDPFNALCNRCNHEMSVYKGMTCVCPHCGAKYTWVEEENRFYPEPSKL